jgi:hypothetical protein
MLRSAKVELLNNRGSTASDLVSVALRKQRGQLFPASRDAKRCFGRMGYQFDVL